MRTDQPGCCQARAKEGKVVVNRAKRRRPKRTGTKKKKRTKRQKKKVARQRNTKQLK